jgi:hypothetical protein
MSDYPARQPPAPLYEILKNSTPEDFDGHTEFRRLTPEQRLAWLDQAVAFIQTAKHARNPPPTATQLP